MANEMTTEQEIGFRIRSIKGDVTRLLELLPKEQQYAGSELQRIDSLANALYHKYLKDIEA